MNKIDLYNKAYNLAKQYHAGQTDKSGKDYFLNHIKVVSDMVLENENNLDAAIVALLHDILEDTTISIEYLQAEFPFEIVEAVNALTNTLNSYEQYIDIIKKNKLAKIVKRYDLANNMDLSRLLKITEKDKERTLKYAKAYAQLMKL